jgi:hypothetical protein
MNASEINELAKRIERLDQTHAEAIELMDDHIKDLRRSQLRAVDELTDANLALLEAKNAFVTIRHLAVNQQVDKIATEWLQKHARRVGG